jgi:hypothetical protein
VARWAQDVKMMSRDGRIPRTRECFVAVIIVFAVWGLVAPAMIFQPLLFDDDASYVAHAMTIGIDFDLDYSNEIANSVIERPSGALTPTHPIGPGLGAAPFVALFSLVDRALGNRVIEDRSAFQGTWSILGFFVASASALFVGGWFYLQSFALLGVQLSRPFVLLLLAGTGVAYYGLNRFTMGHSFEVAAAALVFWTSVILTTGTQRRAGHLLLLVGGMVLSLLIRPANVNVVLLPAIVWTVLRITGVRGPAIVLRAEVRRFIVLILPAVAVLLALNHFLYGFALPSRSQMYGGGDRGVLEQVIEVVRALPLLRHVMFSSEFGVVYFMPVVPIGVLLLAWAALAGWRRGVSNRTRLAAIGLIGAYLTVPLAVVLVWQTHARSYGYRYLYSLVPLGMLGVAVWWRRPPSTVHRGLQRALAVLSGFGVLGQVFFQATSSLRPGPGLNAFGIEYSHSAVGYSFAVLRAIVSPSTWAQMAIVRFPGFVGGLMLGPDRTATLAERLGFVPVTRVSSGIEVGPLTAFQWFAQAAPGTLVAALLLTGVVLPAAFVALSRGRRARGSEARR